MSIIDTLITDRTQADVDALQALYAKPKAMWTAEEWDKFLLGDYRGAYNASDMNRVLDALDYLAVRVTEFGYRKPVIHRPSITTVIPGTSRLPAGYTELDHIRSTGTQHIDSGIPYDSAKDIVIEAECMCSTPPTSFGWDGGGQIAVNSSGYWYSGSSANVSTVKADVFTKLKMTIQAGASSNTVLEITQGNEMQTVTRAHGSIANYAKVNYPLFAVSSSSGGVTGAVVAVKAYRITVGGTVVRDYVPCLDPSNKVGLYDTVSKTFFGNEGADYLMPGPVADLPKGYRRLEYIRSNGTEYVNTGLVPTPNTKIAADVDFLSENTTFNCVFGVGQTTSNQFVVYRNGSNMVGQIYSTKTYTTSGVTNTGRHQVELSNSRFSYGTYSVEVTSESFSYTYPLFLFALNSVGTATLHAHQRLYSCLAYENDTLIRLYTPVINENGEFGLYDAITGAFFGNDGTGMFTAGPVVLLPDGFTELEYIQSSGAEYIDTLFVPNQDTRVVCDFQFLKTGAWQSIFGAWEYSGGYKNAFVAQANTSNVFVSYYGNNNVQLSAFGAITGDRRLVDKNKAVCTVDDVSVTNATATFTCPGSLYLFATNKGNATEDISSAKVWSMQIYDNGTLVRDYVPCKNPSGACGLYDKVGRQFYGNAGTGSFTAGPEISVISGGISAQTVVRDYWEIGDIPNESDLDAYVSNVSTIRGVLDMPSSVPAVPTGIASRMSVEDANHIEIILTVVESLLQRMILSRIYAGEFYSGEV